MARLTNRQLDVLSESIVDKLEEEYKKRKESYEESEEYKEKLQKLRSSEIYQKIQRLVQAQEDLDKEIKKTQKELVETYNFFSKYINLSDWLSHMERHVLSFSEEFNGAKLLTKIQADILLDDQTDAVLTYQKLTKRYGSGTNKELFSK